MKYNKDNNNKGDDNKLTFVKGKLLNIDEVNKLLSKGYNQSQIGQIFNCSRQAINQLIKKKKNN